MIQRNIQKCRSSLHGEDLATTDEVMQILKRIKFRSLSPDKKEYSK